MKTTIHKANTRGHANHGWLDTHHTFSFASYYNPERVHFGKLRVLNDDVVAPGMGFGKHPHDNMEIISIPLKGSLMHQDSMGHQQVIGEHEVQVMSAGTGIFHSEFNASSTDPANFIQIWILPDQKNIQPVYDQMAFNPNDATNQWQTLVDRENGPLKLNQDATLSRVFLSEGETITYTLKNTDRKAYLFVVEGDVIVADMQLSKRDGMGLEEINDFTIRANKDSYLINIEV
jgi:quercetin 2,3-dioxygenase